MKIAIIATFLVACCGGSGCAVIPAAGPAYGYARPLVPPPPPYGYPRQLRVRVVGTAAAVAKVARVDFDHNPQYFYSYILDTLTGDTKSHQEIRSADIVQGSYSVVDPDDGARRFVEYVADSHNGFNAVVHRESPWAAVRAVAQAPVAPIGHVVPFGAFGRIIH